MYNKMHCNHHEIPFLKYEIKGRVMHCDVFFFGILFEGPKKTETTGKEILVFFCYTTSNDQLQYIWFRCYRYPINIYCYFSCCCSWYLCP